MTRQSLSGRTLLMSGGSRGIGLAIAMRAARDGANIAFIAKTDKPDPRNAFDGTSEQDLAPDLFL
jgi:citronellol/citronellal dehydrogenase